MKRIALVLLLILAATIPLWAGSCCVYFYGGDLDPNNPNANSLANENDAIVPQVSAGYPVGAATYQNFLWSSPSWAITGLFTNNQSELIPTSAYWELRSGVSEGNGGTLIASGSGAVTDTPTGRFAFGRFEYHNEIDSAYVYGLPTGTYWFAVVPQATKAGGRSFNSNTFGLNSMGTAIDNEQYFNSAFFGYHFSNANNLGPFPRFSSGVLFGGCRGSCGLGEADIPEPSSLILLGSGFMGVAFAAQRTWFN